MIIALPESFTEYPPDRLLQIFTDHFRQTYGTDCIAALHHNKRKTNYHIHLIFSERTLLEQPIEKVATRNMFYYEKGNHVLTKKEILDEEGNILYEDAKDPLTGVTKFRHGFSGGQKDNKKWGILKSDGTWLVYAAYDYIRLM